MTSSLESMFFWGISNISETNNNFENLKNASEAQSQGLQKSLIPSSRYLNGSVPKVDISPKIAQKMQNFYVFDFCEKGFI